MSKWPGNANAEKTTFGDLSRSDLMSRVRSKGNKSTELKFASLLRKEGLKGWRRHVAMLGKPDFIWPKHKIAVFIDGCFWHGHTKCKRNLKPKTNAETWQKKIDATRIRDKKNNRKLRAQGWIVIRIWECDLAKTPEACTLKIRRAIEKRKSSDKAP